MSDLEKTTEIYSPIWGTHLGDCICSLHHLVCESYTINKCVRISDHYLKKDRDGNIVKRKMCHNLYQIENLILESNRFVIVKDDPTIFNYDQKSQWYKNRDKPFLTNKYQFNANNIGSNLIAYQFDARKPTRGRGFPSKEIETFVVKTIRDMGFNLVKVGAPLTLQECSETLSRAELLVCIMSGMAWVAATTRTPVFIVGNKFTKKLCISAISGCQTFLFSQDYLELIENIRKYQHDRNFYNKNCFKLYY